MATKTTPKKLTRSATDRKLTGLCGGLAEYFDADVTLVRIIVVAIVLISGIVPGALLYAIAAAITPEAGAK